jgi:Na+-transporting NADH:ubiquinone oxidoreductase subunit A
LKNGITKPAFLIFFLTIALSLKAQTSGAGASSNYFIVSLIVVAALILIAVILMVSDNLMRIEAKQLGVDDKGANYSLFPKVGEIFKPKTPKYIAGEAVFFLKKGHDILLEGEPEKTIDEGIQAKTFALQPPNFIGMSPIPKVMVEKGDEVKAGDVIFFDKKRPEIKYTSPVSGEVIAVNRGAKRAITEVIVLKDKDMQYRDLKPFDLEKGKREELISYLLDCGVWPLIRQRPYDIVAEPSITPKNIFISTFDTAPLAPDNNFVVEGRGAAFQKGLDVLNKLTDGKVYLGLDANGKNAPSEIFAKAEGVEKNWFNGPHPSGNVGVQMHHTAPIGTGEKVWALGVQEVITIGALFTEERYNAERIVALSGKELEAPKYVKTYQGANIEDLVKDNGSFENVRFISGDVLSGETKSESGFLNFFDDQVSIIKEGNYYEMFGWLLPLKLRPTISKTFPNFLFPKHKFTADTNTHGEKRAFVMTGQYESVLPMDIYLQHLMKSIIVNDFERMEGLGIYELSEEDIALCEFVCTSKQPLQEILREGLDIMHEQG